jgi:hypothetical protein
VPGSWRSRWKTKLGCNFADLWFSDFLQVALDISGNGKLPQPYYPPDADTGTLNITMFLFSYNTFLNLTISNGTSSGWRNDTFEDAEFKCGGTTTQDFQNAGCQEIMAQESGSTVKHVNWAWPDCLVGIDESDRDRGSYNVRQRLCCKFMPSLTFDRYRSINRSESMVPDTIRSSISRSKSQIPSRS